MGIGGKWRVWGKASAIGFFEGRVGLAAGSQCLCAEVRNWSVNLRGAHFACDRRAAGGDYWGFGCKYLVLKMLCAER